MADDLRQVLRVATGLELVGQEGMSEVVDFCGLDVGFPEKAINGGSYISDKQGVAGFGDEETEIGSGGADS